MPGAPPTMETLVKNAEAAERLIDDINAKIKDVQAKIARKAIDENGNRLEQEREHVRQEIQKYQQYLTLLQIRNGKMYIQKPAPTVVAPTAAGAGDGPATSVPPKVASKEPAVTIAENANEQKPQQPAVDAPAKAGTVKKEGGKPKGQAAPAQPAGEEVVDVGRLDFRIGKIVEVDRHPDADSLYVEKVDVGEPNPRTVVSGLVKHVPLEEMKDRMVVLLCNLKPAKMRGVTSEAMVMCASCPEKVEILIPPAGCVPGDLIVFSGITRNADPVLNPKKKIFETVAPDLKTNDEKIATYKGIPFEVKGKGIVTAPSLTNVNIK